MNDRTAILENRDAFADNAGVGMTVLFESRPREDVVLTIVVPTFRRLDMLVEAVGSAIGQDFTQPFEVVVLDNDPGSNDCEGLLRALPGIGDRSVRYVRNAQNIGIFRNWNRGIELARGQWVTILHDDDLLDPDFATEMFAQMAADPAIDGLICVKREVDRRNRAAAEPRARAIRRRALELLRFGVVGRRRIDARKLFWGNVVGTNVGFVCRKRDLIALGGFAPEHYPVADYYLFARYARRFRLYQTRSVLATMRVEDNLSMKPDVQAACMYMAHDLREHYAGADLPRYWRRLSPLLLARHIAVTSGAWGIALDHDVIERRAGVRIPRDRPLVLYAIRFLLRGF